MLVPYEDRVTGVDLAERRAAGRPGLDDHRRRRHAPRDAAARARARTPPRRSPTAPTKDLGDRLNIRATEFTIGDSGPAAMPGELPPTSAYTYAVEYSVDEANAQQAVDVEFNKPVVTYVDNLLGFPAGTRGADGLLRPREGAVDRGARTGSSSRSSPSPAAARSSTSPATASPTPAPRSPPSASTTPNCRSSPSSTTRARASGAPRSRTSRRGTTTGPTACRTAPAAPARAAPTAATRAATTRATQGGSIILCENQVLGEQSPIAGTPYTLAYQSDRVPGRRTGDTLQIPLTGADAAGVARRASTSRSRSPAARSSSPSRAPVEPLVHVHLRRPRRLRAPRPGPPEGRHHARLRLPRRLPHAGHVPAPRSRRSAARSCRRTHAHGDRVGAALERHRRRRPAGARERARRAGTSTSTTPTTRSGARSTWATAPSAAPRARTSTSSRPPRPACRARGHGRDRRRRAARRRRRGARRAPDRARRHDDRDRRRARRRPASAATAARRPRPSSTTRPTSPSAPTARSSSPTRATTGSAGSPATARSRPSPAPATAATRATAAPRAGALLDEPTDVAVDAGGAVLVVDRANHAIRRDRPRRHHRHARRQRRRRASRGDGGVATRARLRTPRDVAVRADGSVFIADSGNHRVRRIDPDGTITTVAGNGQTTFGGDGGLGHRRQPRHAVGDRCRCATAAS